MSTPQWKVERLYTYGWDDAEWTVDDQPQRFATKRAAEKEIREHCAMMADAVALGHMEDAETRRDLRAVLVEGGAS